MNDNSLPEVLAHTQAPLEPVLGTAIPFIRPLHKGMGEAVAKRTVFRKKADGTLENWGDVAERVALGNTLLVPSAWVDYEQLRNHIAAATILMSGRHLQHGDADQSARNLEVFSNCSTAAASFLLFYLLLNGSGVGRDYSDTMMIVDWDKSPSLVLACDLAHPDYNPEVFVDPVYAKMDLKAQGKQYVWFQVPDSREGWAQAAEVYERMTYDGDKADHILVLDFSKVRPAGAPIGGMQNRPASGPVPTAQAFQAIADVKGKGLPKWKQAMFVDHYLAECVVVGGARRSARMSTKHWKDPGALEYAAIKKHHGLWSSNNSIIADAEFYAELKVKGSWAQKVMKTLTEAAYHDGTGEPGIINVHNFAPDPIDWTLYDDGRFADSFKYSVDNKTLDYMKGLVTAVKQMPYQHITNPCGEIQLNLLGGYCVIADVVPFHAKTLDEAEQAFRLATRALIRANTMKSLYDREVKRTNRIGVGFTGLHEFAFDKFGLGWKDLLDEHGKAKQFWKTMARFARAVKDEAQKYSAQLGVACPATDTTVKPAGTTSKLFGLSEGAHLPSMREYMRNVQFRSDDPLVEQYRKKGYPVQALKTYKGSSIVGFPTQPTICRLGMGDKLVTAPEATPDEQYQYLMLLEKYWLRGVDEQGTLLAKDTGNQVSYTLKYFPDKVSYPQFVQMMIKHQSQVRACSVMPFVDTTAYEYQPEEPFGTVGRFFEIVDQIEDEDMLQDIDMEHLKCSSGSCPL